MSSGETTFCYQNSLPRLPVPPLDQSLDSYLTSVRVFQTESEHAETTRIVERFRNEEGPRLQAILEKRASEKVNWLEEWWEEFAYLRSRLPLAPFVNFGGSSQDHVHRPGKECSSFERAALNIHFGMNYWDMMRREEVPVMRGQGKRPWCMQQVKRMLNSCRIPGETLDQLHFYFKTKSEGPAPSYVVILLNGRIWKMETKDRNGKNYSPPAIEAGLRKIALLSATEGPYVNALTCLDRTSWWKARKHLMKISEKNAEYFHAIESAVCVYSLTDSSPRTDSHSLQLAFYSLAGDARFMYADKCLNFQIHKNGTICSNSEHALVDAIVQTLMSAWIDERIADVGYRWNGETSFSELPDCTELDFLVDSQTLRSISEAIDTLSGNADLLNIDALNFTDFGVNFYKKYKIYGDTAIQLAIQLAYYRLHQKPAPTYETASTRKFLYARTETVRSCTQEALDFCTTYLEQGPTDQSWKKFKAALNRHNLNMLQAMEGNGFDRHMLGLRIAAGYEGLDLELFRDPGWVKAGGDGNFVLSTSFIGYSANWGGVAPMIEDGYGTFYNMLPDKITFFMSEFKYNLATDLKAFQGALTTSMKDVQALIIKFRSRSNTDSASKL